jgi:hypothetical protein
MDPTGMLPPVMLISIIIKSITVSEIVSKSGGCHHQYRDCQDNSFHGEAPFCFDCLHHE